MSKTDGGGRSWRIEARAVRHPRYLMSSASQTVSETMQKASARAAKFDKITWDISASGGLNWCCYSNDSLWTWRRSAASVFRGELDLNISTTQRKYRGRLGVRRLLRFRALGSLIEHCM